MAPGPSQQKDQSVPQLSCVMCRDRKLRTPPPSSSDSNSPPLAQQKEPKEDNNRRHAQPRATPDEDPASQSGVVGPRPDIVQSAEDLQTLNTQVDVAGLPSPASWSLGLSGDFVVDLMDHQRALRLLWAGSFLNTPSPVLLPRDTVSIKKLCELYLQNVDPIIKILHRPTITRWITSDDSPVAESSAGDKPIRALEYAVCYAAATTMTEVQCQLEFKKSKAEISSTYRRMCEDAIEEAGLLTTRDMTVLQAFVLYLVGRKSENKGTAFWALVALAVRLASAMKLNNPPTDRPESFFQQQMRLRLWLTVCLMDLEASLAESSEPLISYRDAASAVSHVRNINDADFNINTSHPVDSSEGLTNTTFALVTYRMQVISRLLNFPASESGMLGADIASWVVSTGSDDCALLDPISTLPPGSEGRRQLVRRFKQEVFGLLHYCDPESSPYAWFTWHCTHCIVAGIRLSELPPFQCGLNFDQYQPGEPPMPTKGQNVGELLCRAVQHLEKTQVINSDPRSQGFRWFIAAPRLALSTAIAECNTCADTAVVRWAWPVIETSFRQYEESASSYKTPLSQVPLLCSPLGPEVFGLVGRARSVDTKRARKMVVGR
ncbi:hypothetical protein DV738_g1189, partial [Chaetothyriales sp. CBS 135597]